MDIRTTRREGVLVLSLEGRLDAQGAMNLEDYLTRHLQDTDTTAVFDMSGVVYLSSAGIRTIIATEKRLRSRKGSLHLSQLQPYPLSVLEMTGFVTLLSLHPTCEEAILAAQATGVTAGGEDAVSFQIGGARYLVTRTGTGANALEITGYPGSGEWRYQGDDMAIPTTISTDSCSMGRGAPGRMIDQSAGQLGDLLTIGNVAAWLTRDCDDTLDYLILDEKKNGMPVTCVSLLSSRGSALFTVQMNSDSSKGIEFRSLFHALSGIASRMDPEYKGVLHLSFQAESPEVRTFIHSPGGRDAAEGFREDIVDSRTGVTLAGCAIALDPEVQSAHFSGAAVDALVHRSFDRPGELSRVLSLIFRDLPQTEGELPKRAVERGLSSDCPVILRHLAPGTMIRKATLHVSVISDILLNTGTDVIIEGPVGGWNADYEKIVKLMHRDCSEVRLHPISGGFSGSLVFRDEAYDHRGRKEMPFVLKLDRWDAISAEVQGYERHVKRYIQNNATQIIQAERCGDFGGILYTFVGIRGTQDRIFSLEEYYRSHATDEVCEVFDILFRTVLRNWYGQPRLRDLPLYQVYSDIFNYEQVKKWAGSRYGVSAEDEYIELPHNMGCSENPLHFMEVIVPGRLASNWSVYEGSVHGDLNMRNVLMDEEKNLWLIDFAMTRHSHILRDIAKMESVLKMEMIPVSSDERLRRLLDIEKVFLCPKKLGEIPHLPLDIEDPDIVKAFAVVTQLRRYADTLTLLDEDIRQYFLALLYYTLCVPAFTSVNEYMREYAWISSSLLCRALK